MSQLENMLETARTNGATSYVHAREGALAADRAEAVDFFDRLKNNAAGYSIDFATRPNNKDMKEADLTNFKTAAIQQYETNRNKYLISIQGALGDGFSPLTVGNPTFGQYYSTQNNTINARIIELGSDIGQFTYYTAPGQTNLPRINPKNGGAGIEGNT